MVKDGDDMVVDWRLCIVAFESDVGKQGSTMAGPEYMSIYV